MKYIVSLAAGLCMCAASVPSYGQGSNYEAAQLDQSVEARIGISLPFGGQRKKANSQPQFTLGLRSLTPSRDRHDWALNSAYAGQDIRELKLGFTIEPKSRFLMNDRVLTFNEDGLTPDGNHKATDTYDKAVLTVIGVSLVVIAGSIIILRKTKGDDDDI